MSSLLQKLEDNRSAILLTEIGVSLHLLGKLSEEFIQAQSQQGGSFGYRQICNNNPLGLDNIFFQIIQNNWVQTIFNTLNNAISNVPQSNQSPNSLCEFMRYHLKREINNFQDCALLKIVTASHDISGAEEKDLPWSGNDPKKKTKQQDVSTTFAASAFGIEDQPITVKNNINNVRDLFISSINPVLEHIKNNHAVLDIVWWQENYPQIMSAFEKAYKTTVGDTQRPVNDVTLWDAASLASALFKSALVKMIIGGWTEPINTSTKKTTINWKILRINFDSLSLMSKGLKIGDILGYRNAIEESISECKKIIEIKYCLGNEIYQDQTGIYFSFPDVDANSLGFWNELTAELVSAIQKIESEISPIIEISASIPDFRDLTSQRASAIKDIVFPDRNTTLSQDISNLWVNVSNSEVCPICRLRPMKENSDGCVHCIERRTRRAEEWIGNPEHTIWLDEVSDHNDRVALLVGSFNLTNWLNGNLISTMAKKTPSSGRIRRCWETTQEFIMHKVFKDILTNFDYGIDSLNSGLRKKRIQFKISPNRYILKGQALDVDLGGIRISPVCIDKDSQTFVNTVNLQILKKWGDKVEEIINSIKGLEVKIKIDSKWENAKIIEPKLADKSFQDYLPYVRIEDFPDQFMAIVPAYDALDIAKKIVEEYEVQFSKVRDRLPFHIGIIAFHRRTPLNIVIDAGKRLLDSFKRNTKSIDARVQEIQEITYNKFGNKVKELTLNVDPSYSSVPLKWNISYSTGDPNQQDEWHPYFRFNGSNPTRGNYSFVYDDSGNYVIHVKKLCSNDCIKIESSYFKLAYLENAAERFKIGDEMRPLDDIERLDELWKDIFNILNKKSLGISQLHSYWQEITKRYKDYEGSSIWENFIKSSLVNMLKVTPEEDNGLFNKLFQATKDGLLDLCFHWNIQVRKINPAKTEDKNV